MSEESSIGLHLLLERAATLLRSEMRAAASAHDLKLAQLEALQFLGLCNRYSDTPASLTDFLGATKGTVSQTLVALERKGLIIKKSDPEDKRVVHCRLSPTGEALFRESFPSPLVEQASPAATDELAAALLSWLASLQKRRGHQSFGVCRSCSHYQKAENGASCGLTGEPLSVDDSGKICREHLPVVQ